MKNTFQIAMAIMLISSCQPNTDKKESSTENVPIDKDTIQKEVRIQDDTLKSLTPIEKIKEQYALIQGATLVSNTIDWVGKTEVAQAMGAAGSVTYYYNDKKQLVKIFSTGTEDHGDWKEDYYFKDGKIFFIYLNNRSGGVGNPTENAYNVRFYVANDKMIEVISNNKNYADAQLFSNKLREGYKLAKAKTPTDISTAIYP